MYSTWAWNACVVKRTRLNNEYISMLFPVIQKRLTKITKNVTVETAEFNTVDINTKYALAKTTIML